MSNKKTNTKTMVQLSILTAIIAVMSFTPLGYLKTLGFSITFLPIPVAIGAIIMGKGAGAFLGGVFGLMSVLQCFGFEPFGTTLMSIDPLSTVIICFIPRIIAGFIAGWLFEILYKKANMKTVSFFVASLSVALINTFIFVPLFVLLFQSTEFFATLNPTNMDVISFIAAFIGINGIIEAIASLIGGGIISKAIYNTVKKAR